MTVKTVETRDLAKTFKALSDPNRLAIFLLIRERCSPGCKLDPEGVGSSVSRIAEQFDLSLSTVSHHIKELKNAGLIRCVKRGQWVYCVPDEKVLERIESFVNA